jgi:NADH-quinone oxidoreductase subunit L
VYLSGRLDWQALRIRFGTAKRTLQRGFYINDFYGGAVVGPAKLAAAFVAYVLDKRIVDGAANGIGLLFATAAGVGRRIQTGFVRNYALAFLLGAVVILLYLAVRF